MANDIFNSKEPILRIMDIGWYQVDTHTAGTVYMRRQSGTGVVLIIRVTTVSDVSTYEKTNATWALRADAGTTYVAIDA